MKSEIRPAFYALSPGGWRDLVTLLHLPYTVWHLSYVVLGAAAAPVLHLDRLAWTVLAFFLAVGLGAHALDEYNGKPLSTGLRREVLLGIAISSIAGAMVIGVIASLTIGFWAVPFVVFGGFIVLAYNLELSGGRFHSDAWFAFAWGAYPALVGYWANAERLDVQAFVVAAACFASSLAQRILSTQARDLRRNAQSTSGFIRYHGGEVRAVTIPYLLAGPEAALRLMGLSIALLALGWLLSRL